MSKRIILLSLLVILTIWYYWPKISSLNILSPVEQELHGYLKEIIPAVRSGLQKFKELDNDPANAAFATDLVRLSDEILGINEKYWKIGSRSKTFIRILINKVRGNQEEIPSFLVHWKGPEKELEALDEMRIDTRTLIYRAWEIKENSNKLAKKLKDLLREGGNSTQEATALVDTCWRSLADVDQVYRRWKGNFRPPFSFS